jgi:organic radical activating enzyme
VFRKNRKENHPLLEKIFIFIELSYAIGFKKVVFTGGEPLFRYQELKEGIRYAKSKGMKTVLITNAFWASTPKKSKEIVNDLCESGLDTLVLSMDYDHLLFVPLSCYVNAIKTSLRKIRIIIRVIDRKDTEKKNTEYLKKLSKRLKGKYIVPPFQKIIENISILESRKEWIFLGKDVIEILRGRPLFIGRAKNLIKEFDFSRPEVCVFQNSSCMFKKYLMMQANGMITICDDYSELHRNYMSKPNYRNFLLSLRSLNLLSSPLGFIKLFLYVRNLEKEKGRKYLKEKYVSRCHLCSDLVKLVNFKNFKQPPTFQLLLFILTHFHLFMKMYFQYLLKKILVKINFLTPIFNII